MKKIRAGLRGIRQAFSKIHLVDKCLIVFMIVLLAQSAYKLFTCTGDPMESDQIDVIVRTSAAAIFGYFISANFICHTSASKKGGACRKEPDSCTIAQAGERQGESPSPDSGPSAARANRIQIIAATLIGLFCLVILIIQRDFVAEDMVLNASRMATIAQFRDFVSGCIGFLIGCPIVPPEQKKS